MHLQVAFYWASARLVCDGPDGLADGLQFIRALCNQYWSTLHPQPAATDPVGLQRLTWLNDLAHAGRYLRLVRDRTLFVPEQGPAVTFNDIAVAENLRAAPEGVTVRSSAEISGLFAEFLKSDAEGGDVLVRLRSAAADAAGLVADVRQRTQNRGNLQLDPLRRMIDAALRVLGAESGIDTNAVGDGAGAVPAATVQGIVNGVAVGPTLSANNPAGIESAQASLKQIIAFFEKVEPSSPVPLILKRAERLIGKTFVECLADLGGSLESVNLVVSSPPPADD